MPASCSRPTRPTAAPPGRTGKSPTPWRSAPDRRAGPPAVRRAGPRCRPRPQAAGATAPGDQARRGGRGPADRPGLLGPAGRAGGVDHADAGRQARRAGGGGRDLRRDGPAGAQKNELKPHLKEQWCIPPGPAPSSSAPWRTCSRSTTGRTTRTGRWSAWTRPASSSSARDRADPGRAGPARAVRLRVHPQRDGQPVHGLRAADGVAARRGDRPADGGGLRRAGPWTWSRRCTRTPRRWCW